MAGTEIKKEVSAEEKLLTLISQTPLAGKGETRAPASARSFFSGTGASREIRQILKRLTGLLVVICLGLAAFVGWSIFVKKPERVVSREGKGESPAVSIDGMVHVSEAPFSAFEEAIRKRDVFSAVEAGKPEGANVTEDLPVPRVSPEEIAANFKVVGIVMDKDPQAVIEDVKNSTTLFLSNGDAMGEGRLESINPGNVVVAFGSQKIELTP